MSRPAAAPLRGTGAPSAGRSAEAPRSLLPEKALLRALLLDARNRIPPDTRAAFEAAIRDRLLRLPAWQAAPVVCGYAAVRGEVDLSPVCRAALRAGKIYALPCVPAAREGAPRLLFRRVRSADPALLTEGRLGIPEPSAACPILPLSALKGALVLVPGLGFDREGFRLGYGGGFYDAFLADAERAGATLTAAAPLFSCCLVPRVPHAPHDRRVDLLIDERGILDTHERGNIVSP